MKTLSLSGIPPRRSRMLYNEVAIYLQVDHPNICKLLEIFVENGQPPNVFMPAPTEPLVNGVSFQGESRRGSITGEERSPDPGGGKRTPSVAGGTEVLAF